MNEFSLIDHFFKSFPTKRKELVFGIGDDAASLKIPSAHELLVSTDTLVSGVHFLPEWEAYDIACKAVMVNLSDMAAMGAEPIAVTLSLTLPEVNEPWLKEFARGLTESLKAYHVDLIGGDTTHGPLSITLTVLGTAPDGQCIRRNGAKAGDVIFVSGQLGGAALAVTSLKNQAISVEDKKVLMTYLHHPKPRVDLTSLLRAYASSSIDISDGLSADLHHICVASDVGASLNVESIPIHPLLKKYLGDEAVDLALTGGDDYELCFTVPKHHVDSFLQQLTHMSLVCYEIGVIEKEQGMRLKTSSTEVNTLSPKGYSHF